MRTRPALFAIIGASATASLVYMYYLQQDPCTALDVCTHTQVRVGWTRRVGAYYQTSGKHLKSLRVVLKLFRRAYPISPLYLYIDAEETSTRFAAVLSIAANYAHITLMPPGVPKNDVPGIDGLYMQSLSASVDYVTRLVVAAQQVDWLILLEDDVWVCNTVPTDSLRYDLNGRCDAKYNWPGGATPGPCYGGCGGMIFNAGFLRSMRVDPAYIQRILAQKRDFMASDELISAVMYQSNGTIGNMPEFLEYMTPYPIVVHQMKGFYAGNVQC